jgi:hypothetical protein
MIVILQQRSRERVVALCEGLGRLVSDRSKQERQITVRFDRILELETDIAKAEIDFLLNSNMCQKQHM